MKCPMVFLAAAAFLAVAFPAFSSDSKYSLVTHLKVVELRQARAPEVVEDSVIFSSSLKARSVGVVLENENFSTIHLMQKNKYGVFFFVYPIPRGMSAPLRYRYVADGAWSIDLSNPRVETDYGTACDLSVVSLPYLTTEKAGIYKLLDQDGRTAHFRFRAASGESIYVGGTFNQWDPFMYEMTESADEPGLYELDLELPQGTQYYCFFYRGQKYADKLNTGVAYTQEGEKVSSIYVP